MRWPEAEVPLDGVLVRRLLEQQHPDLAGLPLELRDAGWDNVMWRLGSDLAVRLPRRAIAAPLIEQEQHWLPQLAPRLPLMIPVPLRVGRPGLGYPWHWSVVPWIDGDPGDCTPATDEVGTAAALGGFLRALHTEAPPDAPYNPYRSPAVASRADTFEARLAHVQQFVDEPALRRVWDDAAAAPEHPGPALWVHGDLHPANTLVRDGKLVAVIDFGDLCAGDPAVDLGAASMSLRGRLDDRFWANYGRPDPALVRRARGWAVFFALMLFEIGLESRPTYATVGRATLDRIATGAG